MIILAFDTSSRAISVALCDGQRLVAESYLDNQTKPSRILVNLIDEVLKAGRVKKEEIEGLVCSRGPGSFTGLKIGMAAAKGLRAALGLPLVTVSHLEALAYPLRMAGRLIVPTVEAGRGKIYAAKYGSVSGELKPLEGPGTHDPSVLVETLTRPAVFCGSGVERCREYFDRSDRDIISAGASYDFPRAGVLAELARPCFEQFSSEKAKTEVPDYLMEPAAIIKHAS